LLKNLRNMLEAGVDVELIEAAIHARKGARKMLPFRYVAAARHAPTLTSAIDRALCATIQDMHPLSGETWVLVDVSGSMDDLLSGKSDLTRMDAACALAAIVPGKVRMFSFSDRCVEVPHKRGLLGIEAIKRSQIHSGTMLGTSVRDLNARMQRANAKGRLIVISDEQSHDPVGDPWIDKAYMINVASYQNGVAYGPRWVNISGFSEGVLKYIAALENEKQWIDNRSEDEFDDTEEGDSEGTGYYG
jgi:60 kDa SS-A/Ro ribonucleoprotein